MKNEMALTTGRTKAQGTSVSNAAMAGSTAVIGEMGAKILAPLSRYYSDVLGQTVGTRQTMTLLNAQLAFICTVFPATCPFVVRLLFLFWFVSALLKCRNSIRTCD